MVDFRSGYVPPGVYVTADNTSVATAVGATPTVICLVGPGLGYRSIVDRDTFSNNTDSFKLTKKGANQNSLTAVGAVTSESGGVVTTYKVGDDYTVTSTNGSAPDSVTTIAIVQTGSIVPGVEVQVSYTYADTDYYGLNQFNDFVSFSQVYGNPFSNDGKTLQSPLSLAAQIAFDNGANVIYAVALNNLGSYASQYKAAYAQSAANYDINLVVPVWPEGDDPTLPNSLDTMQQYATDLISHLRSADSDGFPRNSVVGMSAGFDSSVTPDQVSSLFDYRRVVLAYPNLLNYYNAYTSPPKTTPIGGQYLAAALSGVLANNQTAQGLTRQRVYSFTGINADILPQQTTTNKNTWSSRGVAVLESNRRGQLVIRHGVTTDVSSITSREFSIVRCQDELFNEIQQSLEGAQLIGTPIRSDTALNVKAIIAGALETAMANDTIQGYTNLSVRQQVLPNGDPTVIECVFSYKPTYPLNFITVTFSFDLSTGDITTTTDTAGESGS